MPEAAAPVSLSVADDMKLYGSRVKSSNVFSKARNHASPAPETTKPTATQTVAAERKNIQARRELTRRISPVRPHDTKHPMLCGLGRRAQAIILPFRVDPLVARRIKDTSYKCNASLPLPNASARDRIISRTDAGRRLPDRGHANWTPYPSYKRRHYYG